MHFPRNLAFSCMAFAAFVALSAQAFATTVVVGTCKTGVTFPTIGAAIAAAPAGATVDVCPGTYPEQLLIDKNLTLTGIQSGTNYAIMIVPPSAGLVANGVDIGGSPVAAQIFVQNASAVKINHLIVDGTGNNLTNCGPPAGPTLEGIYFQNASGQITNNAVRNQYLTDFTDLGGCQNGLAINIESTTPSTVSITNNSVRNYQKNGITADGLGDGTPGPAVTIYQNAIVGMAATAMNWPGGAAENGVQVGFGATGSVNGNTVNDNIWFNDTSDNPGNAASGILVYASAGVTVTENRVGSAQFGITTDTDPSYGPADNTIITSNKVVGTQIFDAIDVCSSSNTVEWNTVYGSTQSGIHLDDACSGTSNSNTVSGNEVHEACAGILQGTGSGTTLGTNTFYDVPNTTLAGDVCPVTPSHEVSKTASKHASLRPSPYRPRKK
jgi:parallel beta-helix repeat protein